MDRFLIVANWKANDLEPINWFKEFEILNLKFENQIEIAVAPAFPTISTIPNEFTRASQDISSYPAGAYTGEVSAKLLAGLGVKYCLVGHSERRKYLHETNKEVEEKMSQAIANGIMPILCAQTLEEIPENIRNFSGDKYLIMYEPFSAISTGGNYHPESVEKVITTLANWKNKLNLQCRFLYGGSVNPDYVKQLISSNQQPVSGLVVGHASLETQSFFDIINQCLKALH